MSRARRSTRLLAVLAVLLAAVLAGCAGAEAPPGPAPVRPVPSGTAFLPPGSAAGAGPAVDTSCGDPTASLRPAGPLPAPGSMPAGSAMERIQRAGVLVVGVDQSTFPFGYRDPATGALAGADIALAREMARALFGDPERVRFRTESSGQRIANLTSATMPVDLVVQTMSATCERRRQIEFSTPYFVAQQRLLVPRTSPVQTLADLGAAPGRPAGRVCTIAASTSLAAIQSEPSGPIPVTVPEKSDCLVLLQQGQVDAISTDDTILAGFVRQDSRLELRGPNIGSGEPYVVGLSRHRADLPCPAGDTGAQCANNDAFVRFVNGALDRLRANGTLARIYAPAAVSPASATPPPARYRE